MAHDVTIELAIGADIKADPATWSWTDVTPQTREARAITITRGRRSRVGQYAPTRVAAVCDNTDGNLCRHNPLSTHFGQLKKNTPMRVSVDNGSGDKVRAAVFVPGFPPTWDPSEQDQIVTINARGLFDRLGRSRTLRSPLYRTMSGIGPSDYVPAEYWPLEDGSDATRFASALVGGQAGTFAGDISLASDDTLAGSTALPAFDAFSQANFAVRAYATTTQWVVQLAMKVGAEPSAAFTFAEIKSTGTARTWRLVVTPGSPADVGIEYYDSSGALIAGRSIPLDGSGTANPSEAEFFGNWAMYTIVSGRFDDTSYHALFGMTLGTSFETIGGGIETGSHGAITSIRLYGATGASFGHLGVWTDPAFDWAFTDADNNAAAMLGHAGEMAHERVTRLCREESIPCTVTATESQAMGPQSTSRLLDLLRECADTDVGLLYENTGFGVTFVSSSERTNQTAAITLDYSAGEILAPWDPDDDDTEYFNDVTATRPDGSFFRAADEDAIDEVGEYSIPARPNVQTDDQLPGVAGWLQHLGTCDELTWPAVKPNLTISTVLDAWLDTDLGDQLHVTDHPSPLAPDTIRQVIEGYTEVIRSTDIDVTAVLSPASVWDVTELDDADSAMLDTDGAYLSSAATSTGTTFQVATATGTSPLWSTDAGDLPDDKLVGGEVVTATAVAAPTTITYGAVGTAAHANNASVTPGIPASVAAGNLLLVLAAIRNSGTGVPDTPSGYTRLPIFDASSNVQVFGKVAVGGDTAPTITFTGGVANATCSAQMIRIAGAFSAPDEAYVTGQSLLNASAQDIAYPGLLLRFPALATTIDNAIVIYVGWKQDDWTSVATISGATEIAEASSTTGDDQALVWDYVIQTTAANIADGSFTVTGGASAISRGAVFAIRSNVQAITVTRSVNGVVKPQTAGTAVVENRPARLAL